MPKSKARKPKTNYYGARKDEVACFGLQVCNYEQYMDEILKTGDSKKLTWLLKLAGKQDGFIGVYTPQTSKDILEHDEKPYCLIVFDTKAHRNNAYVKLNELEKYTKEVLDQMTKEELDKIFNVALIMRVIYIKKDFLEKENNK